MNHQQKLIIVVSVLVLLGVISLSLLIFFPPEPTYTPGVSIEQDKAVTQAIKVYHDKKRLGVNFSEGPCLTNDLMPNWVADIAHNPRKSIDNYPQNQCQAFLEGRAKHFVELDPEGKLIRVQ